MAERIEEGELLAEVRRVVHETRERIVSGAETPSSAYGNAYADSCARDIQLGSTAGIIAGWLIDSSGEPDDPDSARRALALLQAPETDSGLGRAVLGLIRRVAGNEISNREFLAATRKPWRRRPANTRQRRPTRAPGAIDVDEAVAVLKGMLDEGGIDWDSPDPLAVWSVFKVFAERPAYAAEGVLQHDACVFQWGVHAQSQEARFEWAMTRQFTLADLDGDYSHMEQLHCVLLFEPEAHLIAVGVGDCWSGDDVREWTTEVEALPAFSTASAVSRPSSIEINQERV